jgi:hypothetical protein
MFAPLLAASLLISSPHFFGPWGFNFWGSYDPDRLDIDASMTPSQYKEGDYRTLLRGIERNGRKRVDLLPNKFFGERIPEGIVLFRSDESKVIYTQMSDLLRDLKLKKDQAELYLVYPSKLDQRDKSPIGWQIRYTKDGTNVVRSFDKKGLEISYFPPSCEDIVKNF